MSAPNLPDIVDQRAATRPEAVAFRFLGDGENETGQLTYAELAARAHRLARRIGRSARPGDRALLACPAGLEFPVAFLGCLYAGVIAVPIEVPKRRDGQARLAAAVRDSGATLLLSQSDMRDRLPACGAPWQFTDADDSDRPDGPDPRPPAAHDIAYIQYTSGSTQSPRGVAISHRALMRQLDYYRRRGGPDWRDLVLVGWLPHTHDFGLVGFVLSALFMGTPYVWMPPSAFLRRPTRWLEAISRYRGSYCGGPGFGYDLCASAGASGLRADIDLSCWRMASLGGDYIAPRTLAGFEAAFAPHGFRRAAWLPAYGLAESVLCATGRHGAVVKAFDAAALRRDVAVPANDDDAGVSLVSFGAPMPGQHVRIVDPDKGVALPDGAVGEVWLAGDSLADGYWNNPTATALVFRATLDGDPHATPHLRTGDRGFRLEGELFITGRLKDLIVVHGKNHAPDDVEQTIQSVHPALRAGCGAVVQAGGPDAAGLIAVQEVSRVAGLDHQALFAAINQAVTRRHGLALDTILLIRAGSLPRTRNGKICRRACAATLNEDAPRPVARWDRPAPNPSLDEVGTRLLAHLQDILPGRTIRAEQNLFEIGMDSLAIHSLLARLHADSGIDLPVEAVFESPTVAGLAARLARQQPAAHRSPPAAEHHAWADVSPAAVMRELRELRALIAEQTRLLGLLASGTVAPAPAANAKSNEPFALSETQREIRLLSELHGDAATVFNVMMVLEHPAPLDMEALRRAARAVAKRHESLRTVFEADQQRVLPFADPDLNEVVLESTDAIPAWLQAERSRPFAPHRAPAWRLNVLEAPQTWFLVLTAHHLVLDGSSVPVFAREFLAHYSGSPPDEAAPLQFREFRALGEQRRVDGNREARSLYWRDRLGDRLPDWVRPGDDHGSRIATYDAGVHTLRLDGTLLAALRRRGAAAKATLFHALLAALFVLLHRVSGQERIVIGIDAANRAGPREDEVIGCCNVLLPIVIDFAQIPTVAALLSQVRARVLEAVEHRDYTLTMWEEDRRVARDPARPFKLTACMNMQRFPARLGLFRPRFDLEAQSISRGPFGFVLDVRDQDDAVRIDFIHNTRLLDRTQVSRFAAFYQRLLEGMARDAAVDVLALPMLSQAETDRLLSWSGAERPAADFIPIMHRFAAVAAATPDAEAVACREHRLSYRELEQRVTRLAHAIAHEVPPGAAVALAAHRDVSFLVSMLAILTTGRVYLPLDPRDPDTRLNRQLAQADAGLLLHDADHRDLAQGLRNAAGGTLRTLCIDAPPGAESDTVAEPGFPVIQADMPAYLLFTSGSSGEPKAATIAHGGMVNHLLAKIDVLGLTAADIVAQTAAQTFDISVWQFLAPLLVGGRVRVFDDRVAHDPGALFAETERHRITVLQMVPSILRASIEILLDPGQNKPLRALRWLISTGEALPADLCRRWISLYPRVPVINAYGPTECSDDVTHHVVEWPPADGVVRVPIGRPIAGAEIYVVDKSGGLAPIGAVGELYVGGGCVGLGYRDDAARTLAAFVPNTVTRRSGARLYRTGDLVRFQNDGVLDCLGRLDQQVKINGVRIEPREIEIAIQRDPAVLQSLVMARCNGDGMDTLVAYVVFRPGMSAHDGALRAAARRSLPPSLVPSRFVFLDALPVMSNGKLDLARLPEPEPRPRPIDTTPPSNATETVLLQMWSDTIRREGGFGVHEDFFDLGGGSVDATALVARIEDQFKVRIPVSTIFRAPTVASLAAAIETLRARESGMAHQAAPEQVEFRTSRRVGSVSAWP